MIPDPVRWRELADALEYPVDGPASAQETYVEAFDFDPDCSLELGWHLFGDSPERGAFLAMLRSDLARAGIEERGSLPDYLPTLMRLLARVDEDSAASLIGLIRPAAVRVRDRLSERGSPLAGALADVVAMLEAVPDREEQP